LNTQKRSKEVSTMGIPSSPKVLALAVFSAFSMNASTVFAQGEEGASALEEVIVTGTRAQGRSVLDSAVPVDVLTADDLENVGALGGELASTLEKLVPSFSFPRQSNSDGADHVRAAQLRGMSPDQTLVMVNGKRRHTSSVVNLGSKIGKGTNPVDFNTIPTNAIERVEVLRDGAGAQYGSDAIAGVVNLILKGGAEGGRVTVSYGEHNTDFDPTGKTIRDGDTVTVAGDIGFALGDEGFLRVGGEYRDRDGTNRAGFDQIPFWEASSPENEAVRSKVNYYSGDPKAEDWNFFYNMGMPLGDAMELYSFGTMSKRESEGANFYRYPDSWENVSEIYPNGFRPVSEGENNDFSIAGGVRGESGDWDWDVSMAYGENDFDYDITNSLNTSFGVDSDTSFDRMEFTFDQLTLNADASREYYVDAFSGPLTLSVGTEYRIENFVTTKGSPQSYLAGPVDGVPVGVQAGPGLSPEDEADLDRDVLGFYVDVEADVTDSLLLTAAARYEDYDDFGDTITGKFAGSYRFTEDFTWRASVGTSFRAPSLAQVGFESTAIDFGDGGRLVRIKHISNDSAIADYLGADDLKEEESFNLSTGFTWAVSDSFYMTLDVFQIEVDDRITVSERIGTDPLLVEDATGIADVTNVTLFTNAIDTKTKGVDLVANYEHDFGSSQMTVMAAYNYSDTEVTDVHSGSFGDSEVFGVEERNTIETAAPQDKIILSSIWRNNDWSVMARATRHGETTRVFDFGGGYEPEQTYGEEWVLDAEVSWLPTSQWTLTLGGNNITDEYPDESIDDIAYFGNLPYDVLSGVGMNGAYYYVRTSYSF
jgi:iron complex outermembrane receptor protein